MKKMKLNNGIEMPLLGFGTYKCEGEEGAKTIAEAVEVGYRMFDTASLYKTEDSVGKGIKASGIDRKDVFVITKVWFTDYNCAYDAACESLKKLDMDYVDCLLLHWPFGDYYSAWRDFERLYKEGKTRSVGVSNFNPDRLLDLIAFNEIHPAINQVETNLYCQREEHHIWFEKYGVAHQGYRPLLGRDEYKNNSIIKKLCEKYSKTPVQIVLNFLSDENISLIPKSSDRERMIENMNIFDFSLTEEEKFILKSFDRNTPGCGYPEKPRKIEEMILNS